MREQESAVSTTSEGALIEVTVTPNAKIEKIGAGGWDNRIHVRVREQAVKGKANSSVLTLFRRLFGNCEIVAGEKTRKKRLLIPGVSGGEVLKKLEKALETK